MLSKSTLIKIAVGVLVIAIIWFIMKLRKGRAPSRKVIVTAMPVIDGVSNDLYDTNLATLPPKELYEDYEIEEAAEVPADVAEEEFTEYSSPEFKSDLLEN